MVNVDKIDMPWYRTRKGDIAINVLGVCNRDMKFIFVFLGWEGFATDSRVLRDAISRLNRLRVLNDKIYKMSSLNCNFGLKKNSNLIYLWIYRLLLPCGCGIHKW